MPLKLMSVVMPTSFTTYQNTREDSEKLLNQLLECVQNCQRRFGGKTELATEFETCIAALCLTLEAVFSHGLRSKPLQPQQLSKLTVSDIVTNSLHLGNDSPSFWPFIKKHLTKHEEERYAILKHVWTDVGRGRAWLRSALNERSLERYCHTVLSNEELLACYYDDCALLRDVEKNSLLPNMAAGLNSILFAVSIDKPELNSTATTQHINRLKSKPEPIIEAPIPNSTNRLKEKKKRKVAKQLISFDEDDSVLSSSIPSSSSSITSDYNSPESSKEIKEDSIKEDKMEQDAGKEQNCVSIEKNSVRRKYSSSLEGPLTPVASVAVGELTPVSVETPKDFDTLDTTSDDTVEVPTDISAVLTVVENKNKEEINKLQDKINVLNKENDNLKDQLQKYVSAVKLLQTDEEGLENEVTVERIPDYKSEAKVFEKKLVQVAEMHAELIDFNTLLQKSLSQKDVLIERLKGELEELRGPMSTDDVQTNDNIGRVNVWIPSAFLTGTGSDTHHVYQIYMRAGNDEWNIYRRYAQFHALHSDLKKLDPAVATFDFPPKKSIGKKDSSLVEDRRKRLQIYLRKVLAHWPELTHCNNRFLLEQHLPFFKDQKEGDQKNKKNRQGVFSSKRVGASSSTENHYTGL